METKAVTQGYFFVNYPPQFLAIIANGFPFDKIKKVDSAFGVRAADAGDTVLQQLQVTLGFTVHRSSLKTTVLSTTDLLTATVKEIGPWN